MSAVARDPSPPPPPAQCQRVGHRCLGHRVGRPHGFGCHWGAIARLRAAPVRCRGILAGGREFPYPFHQPRDDVIATADFLGAFGEFVPQELHIIAEDSHHIRIGRSFPVVVPWHPVPGIRRDVRSRQGAWGVFSRDLLTRSMSFELALIAAFASFYNEKLYYQNSSFRR